MHTIFFNRSLTCLSVACCLLAFSSCKVGRFVRYNFANITDHRIFPYRELQPAGNQQFQFATADSMRAPKKIDEGGKTESFESYLSRNKTVAFLIIRNDTLLYERYFNGYEQGSTVASFSMAKSVISMLIGCAIDDGYIRSADEYITNYIPELKDNGMDAVTIEHLLQMTSGLDFNESYANPFGHAASFYYGKNLRKQTTRLKLKRPPGEAFEYVSGNSQLLGLVLERALKDKTITAYLQEKIWTPLGMEYSASWSLDQKENGLEKTFCCLNARARDFARLGRLYLNNGNWQGKQVIPAGWVKKSTAIDTAGNAAWYYQYQWWIPARDGSFMAQGILGQYVYVYPEKNLIIVRLGKNEGKADWTGLFRQFSMLY